MEKEAVLLGALGGHVAQNAIGRVVAKNKGFKKGLAESAIAGAMGKKSPRTVGSVTKDIFSGLAVPERNMLRNEAYEAGSNFAKKHNIDINKMSKREMVTARAALTKGRDGLKRIGQSKNPKARSLAIKASNLVDRSKETVSKISKLPDGHRPPSSNKAAIAANIAVAPASPGLAAINAAKLASSSKMLAEKEGVKRIKKVMTVDPAVKSYKSGKEGGKFSKLKNNLESFAINPFTAEANKDAYNAGRNSSKVDKLVSKARKQKGA